MNRFINFDSPCLDIFFQEIMDRDHFVLVKYFGIPILQTKPGRIIGMASFGQQERLALQPLHMFNYSANKGLH